MDSALAGLYRDFDRHHLLPLWTQREDLMPHAPRPAAVPHLWRWSELYPLAERAGALVPVGRGGERRAVAIANPGLPGLPYATSTLWAAVQYLGPKEVAPDHRHSQNAFRFVLEGEGVWTVVNGDPVAMRRGDLLLTPGWAWHGHHNTLDAPMAWLDGLDIPLASQLDATFFEFGPDEVTDRSTPRHSRGERLWGHPGLVPVAAPADGPEAAPSSPLAAYRWEHTDAALRAQLELEAEGHDGTLEHGHAAVRFTHPGTGGDALPTLRTEMHRLRAGVTTTARRETGSSVWQVFDGSGTISLDGRVRQVSRGDLFAVPPWCTVAIAAHDTLDLFRFSDAPVFERLGFARSETVEMTEAEATDVVEAFDAAEAIEATGTSGTADAVGGAR
ncbi:cupin domain-containing protein [Streptomyces formicae]|uniref:Cupin domain-containing protein n=1 Tax=Streptomyces formicae TaxID=1616117 RepID=A0ABY3X3H6_9ACTN|nr:cupin domain-containing protein [Streptomyces formicae]UNM16568.1 cupin domain-containing protein [Streptomyces formicae]